DPQSCEANPQRCLRAAAQGAVHANDEEEKENRQMNNAFAVLLVVKGAQARQKSQKESQYRARSHSGDYGCGHGRRRRCAYSRIAGKTRNRLRRNSYNLREAILAVEHVADRPHAHRAHRLSAIAAKTCGVRLGMDRTLHGILLEPASPPIVHGAATKGISS